MAGISGRPALLARLRNFLSFFFSSSLSATLYMRSQLYSSSLSLIVKLILIGPLLSRRRLLGALYVGDAS